uniref:Tetratricopeptide repeat protein n=1 Tax=Panagrolaimus sp. ES5 TaxID=591445 RepID=A0AC34FXF8_9BILA
MASNSRYDYFHSDRDRKRRHSRRGDDREDDDEYGERRRHSSSHSQNDERRRISRRSRSRTSESSSSGEELFKKFGEILSKNISIKRELPPDFESSEMMARNTLPCFDRQMDFEPIEMRRKFFNDAKIDLNGILGLAPFSTDFSALPELRNKDLDNPRKGPQALREKLQKEIATKFVEKAAAFVREKKNDEGIKAFNEALQTWPNFVPALIGRSAAYANQKRFDEALFDLRIVRDIEPENETAN